MIQSPITQFHLRTALGGPVCICAAIVLLLVFLPGCQRPREVGLGPGDTAPLFSGQTLDGQPVTLESFRGRVVVLNFWAAWCGTCLAEMPELEALHKQASEKGITVLAVGLEDTVENFKDVQSRLGLTLPIVIDADIDLRKHYRIWGFPETFILDKEGRIQQLLDADGATPVVRLAGPREWTKPVFLKQLEELAVQ